MSFHVRVVSIRLATYEANPEPCMATKTMEWSGVQMRVRRDEGIEL